MIVILLKIMSLSATCLSGCLCHRLVMVVAVLVMSFYITIELLMHVTLVMLMTVSATSLYIEPLMFATLLMVLAAIVTRVTSHRTLMILTLLMIMSLSATHLYIITTDV